MYYDMQCEDLTCLNVFKMFKIIICVNASLLLFVPETLNCVCVCVCFTPRPTIIVGCF